MVCGSGYMAGSPCGADVGIIGSGGHAVLCRAQRGCRGVTCVGRMVSVMLFKLEPGVVVVGWLAWVSSWLGDVRRELVDVVWEWSV